MRIFAALLLLAGMPAPLHCQTPDKLPVVTYNLRHVIRSAGIIFSGTVVNVERSTGSSTGITRITFRVDEAIRGARGGQLLQVCEWSGLWNAGERYRSGEHVFLFLYPSSKLGLTSPVAGAQGRLAIDKSNRVLPNGEHRHLKAVEVRAFAAAIRRAAEE